MRTIIHIIFIALLALVTFFGLGPVLFADGSMSERLISLFVIIGLYVVLIYLYRKFLCKYK